MTWVIYIDFKGVIGFIVLLYIFYYFSDLLFNVVYI